MLREASWFNVYFLKQTYTKHPPSYLFRSNTPPLLKANVFYAQPLTKALLRRSVCDKKNSNSYITTGWILQLWTCLRWGLMDFYVLSTLITCVKSLDAQIVSFLVKLIQTLLEQLKKAAWFVSAFVYFNRRFFFWTLPHYIFIESS